MPSPNRRHQHDTPPPCQLTYLHSTHTHHHHMTFSVLFATSPFLSPLPLSYIISLYLYPHPQPPLDNTHNNMPPSTTTTRWCPTPEQLMILEELYRRGLRTPNASQIQRITAHLAFYGKIQGKNVFYWFQNHKARDRQKLRKKLAKQLHQQHQHLLHHHSTLYHPPPHFTTQQPLDFFHLPPQGTGGVCEGAPEEVMMRWRAEDLRKDWSHRSDGHDSLMIMEVGPTTTTFPCCRSNKPLQTLELFPLTSPASYSDDP